jgi:hypothetical protein
MLLADSGCECGHAHRGHHASGFVVDRGGDADDVGIELGPGDRVPIVSDVAEALRDRVDVGERGGGEAAQLGGLENSPGLFRGTPRVTLVRWAA